MGLLSMLKAALGQYGVLLMALSFAETVQPTLKTFGAWCLDSISAIYCMHVAADAV